MGSNDLNSDTDKAQALDLTAHFLIAMPGMGDQAFSKSVVYLCEHSERGALGIVINKPIDLTLPKLFAKVDLPFARMDLQQEPVFGGGPLHTERGFVLHEKQVATQVPFKDQKPVGQAAADGDARFEAATPETPSRLELILALAQQALGAEQPTVYASSMTVHDGLEVTTSKDVLEAMSCGGGPRKVLISLGHAAWASGQLESELAENAWLHVKACPQVIFDTPVGERYDKALALLGLQEWMISREAGRA